MRSIELRNNAIFNLVIIITFYLSLPLLALQLNVDDGIVNAQTKSEPLVSTRGHFDAQTGIL